MTRPTWRKVPGRWQFAADGSGRFRELSPAQIALCEQYVQENTAAGLAQDVDDLGSRAARFVLRYGDVADFAALPTAEQLTAPADLRPVIVWALVTGRLPDLPDFMVATRLRLGAMGSRLFADYHARFTATNRMILSDRDRAASQDWTIRQWNNLIRIGAVQGVGPAQVSLADLTDGHRKLFDACMRADKQVLAQIISMGLFEASATLFHMGQIDAFPERLNHLARRRFEMAWSDCAPAIAAVFCDYLAQRAAVRRASTVNGDRQGLMRFATFLAEHHPDVASLTQLRRGHIEDYKRFLAVKPTPRGGKLSKNSVYRNMVLLRTVFDHLAETGHPEAPAGRLVFPGDMPTLDRPLPRFIDDGAAAELLRAARCDQDAFTRIAIEMLARTGLRISELLDLTTDAVVQIGSAYWLHVPLGKLHNDRYIPLHPQLKEMLDAWLADRPAGLCANYIFMRHGRRISKQNLRIGLERVTAAAGIGHVTPHQLRHTLATQAINRGMSLEAIAALLGHKTLAMTQVYARIADKTVSDEYFAVSEQVEALYGAPRELPAEAEGKEMRKLRAEMHRRMLGNGYCARPVELDCHFESICESCSFFVTTIEFRPTLQAQRDDAAHKGQVGRVKVFDGLLARLDDEPGHAAS